MDVARLLRISSILIVVLLTMTGGVIILPPLVLRDAPAPTVLAPYVRSARASVRQNIEGLLPVHLRYVGARCRAGGGTVILFEQWQPPYLNVRYAYAMAGSLPTAGWSGGTGWDDLAEDPEIAAFLGSKEVVCR